MLRSGRSLSCGCRPRFGAIKHGHSLRGQNSPEYRAWVDIISRCTNPKCPRWADYGGRGIGVCDRWRENFAAFLGDVGARPSRRHSIDRIDNERGYEPGNCRWATDVQQQRNRRNNLLLTHRGETRPLVEWVGISGISKTTIRRRLQHGWTAEDALTVQPQEQRRVGRA